MSRFVCVLLFFSSSVFAYDHGGGGRAVDPGKTDPAHRARVLATNCVFGNNGDHTTKAGRSTCQNFQAAVRVKEGQAAACKESTNGGSRRVSCAILLSLFNRRGCGGFAGQELAKCQGVDAAFSARPCAPLGAPNDDRRVACEAFSVGGYGENCDALSAHSRNVCRGVALLNAQAYLQDLFR